jgi:hypothetical protein
MESKNSEIWQGRFRGIVEVPKKLFANFWEHFESISKKEELHM